MINAPSTTTGGAPGTTQPSGSVALLRDRRFVALLLAVGLVVTLEIVSFAGWNIPAPWAPWIFAALILGVGWRVLRKGVEALLKLRFSSINLLMLIATVAAFYLGQYTEAAVVIVLYTLGEQLEHIGIS
ncbi:MAG: hypothetical protein EPO68_14910, partial [Planctomycetota bacterium]